MYVNKCFIWLKAKNSTKDYHDSAGIVIFARDLEEARSVAKDKSYVTGVDNDDYDNTIREDSEMFSKDPDKILDFDNMPRAFVFKNAGCC